MAIEHKEVKSSFVHSVGYDAETQTMEVALKSGAVYRYPNTPAHVHKGIVEAESVGKAFGKLRGAIAHKMR
jgi:KTSC domain